MIIAVMFFMLFGFEESQNETGRARKILLIVCSPILPVYTLLAKSWTSYKIETEFHDAENDKDELKRLTRISNQAHLIEVCTESSLQPLVQLFSIFSGLMEAYSKQENTKWDETVDALLAADWSVRSARRHSLSKDLHSIVYSAMQSPRRSGQLLPQLSREQQP